METVKNRVVIKVGTSTITTEKGKIISELWIS